MTSADEISRYRRSIADKDFATVLPELDRAVRDNPGSFVLWELIAEAVRDLGDPRLAAETLVQGATLDRSKDAWMRAAKAYQAIDDQANTAKCYKQALVFSPADLDTLVALAGHYVRHSKFADAHYVFRQAVDLAPKNEALVSDFLVCAVNIQKAGTVQQYLEPLIKTTKFPPLLLNFAVAAFQSGQLDEAEQALARFERHAKPTGVSLENRALVSWTRGNPGDAADFALSAARAGQSNRASIAGYLTFARRDTEVFPWLASLPIHVASALSRLLDVAAGKQICRTLAEHNFDEEALADGVEAFLAGANDSVSAFALALVAEVATNRFKDDIGAESLCRIFPPASFQLIVGDPRFDDQVVHELTFTALRITARQPIARNRQVFAAYIAPGVDLALAGNRPHRAHMLAISGYQMVQSQPDQKCHDEYIGHIYPGYRRWAAGLPSLTPQHAAGKGHGPLRIAYFVDHFIHEEAPDLTLLGYTKGIASQFDGQVQLSIYALAGISDTAQEIFSAAGASIVSNPFLQTSGKGGDDRLLRLANWLGEEMARKSIDAIVYFGTTASMCYSLSPCLTAIPQIYFSVAYENFPCDTIVGRMIATHPIGGQLKEAEQSWWQGKGATLVSTASESQLEKAKAVRRKYATASDTVILGAIARGIKLTDDFLDALAAVLRARANAVFLWTDLNSNPVIEQKLESRGIQRQCRYVGYVDYIAFAHVLDIHLDPFPFASGITMRQTWSAGGAYVTMERRYADQQAVRQNNLAGIFETYVEPVLGLPAHDANYRICCEIFGEHRERLFSADSVSAYTAKVIRLIDSSALRKDVGMAAAAYARHFISDFVSGARDHVDGIRFFMERHAAG